MQDVITDERLREDGIPESLLESQYILTFSIGHVMFCSLSDALITSIEDVSITTHVSDKY